MFCNLCTVKAPVFGTLNSAISNRFIADLSELSVMEVLKYYWISETSNMQCNYNSFIQIINFHKLFRNALRCRKTGACRILMPLRYVISTRMYVTYTIGAKSLHTPVIKLKTYVNSTEKVSFKTPRYFTIVLHYYKKVY